MNITFVKQLKTHTPANGCMAIWQPVLRSSYATEGGRVSRLSGIVGLKI